MRRIWLHDVGLFEIIPNSGKGSCLFQAISQALTCSTRYHHKIRISIVKHMTSPECIHNLEEFPEFWKRKLLNDWLVNEQQSINSKPEGASSTSTFVKRRFVCCANLLRKAIKWRRRQRCNKVKKLLKQNTLKGSLYLKHFKFIFQKLLSARNEPGTRYELEAAANKFHFHCDFLQALPLNEPTQSIKFTGIDFLNNNNQLLIPRKCSEALEENGGHTDNNDNDAAPSSPQPEEDDGKVVNLKMGLYQFHSCRSTTSPFSQYQDAPVDHFYFLHSPQFQSSDDVVVFPKPDNSKSHNGHWELLLPISVFNPLLPLNRSVFGLTYEIPYSARKFSRDECGQKMEIADTVAEAIDSYIQQNPDIIPLENSPWLANEDDWSSCSSRKAVSLRDSVNGNGNVEFSMTAEANVKHDGIMEESGTIGKNDALIGKHDNLNNYERFSNNNSRNCCVSSAVGVGIDKTSCIISRGSVDGEQVSIPDLVRRCKTCAALIRKKYSSKKIRRR